MRVKQRWDIFCKIVDNFGDIGICWRLARQLHVEHGLELKLWIDDLGAAQRIIPRLDLILNQQVIDEISISKWDESADFSEAADVVIEAFACELPGKYLAAMVRKNSKWVNLEYLSAEPWVDDFHAKPSPQRTYKLTRHFYFPGFTEATGGLIRECDIIESNQLFANNKDLQKDFLEKLNLAHNDHLKVSLFCYPHAAVQSLLGAMATSGQSIDCYVPDSNILPQIASFFGRESIDIGEKLAHKSLHLYVLPFLSQADYDNLLSICDINFVRGEDSWVRAIWAGKPFIWLPYLQEENTHIKKLNAFLDVFYADFEKRQVVCEAHRYWVAGRITDHVWHNYMNHLPAIHSFTHQRTNQLAKQADLASKLVIFCNKI